MPMMANQYRWAEDRLHDLGYIIDGEIIIVRDRPWSCVASCATSQGKIYLKSMAKPYSNEANLIYFLQQHRISHIPSIIALNNELSCFLMKDAGYPLREKQKTHFEISYLQNSLELYADLQIQCIPLVKDLLSLGVPDWRLTNVPALYKQFIEQENLFLKDGLSSSEYTQLKHIYPAIENLCQKLASYKIPETLEHGDFHDNNILLKDTFITINDWGDSTISHPFLSLAAALDSANRNHHLAPCHEPYQICRDAYLRKWQHYATIQDLREAFEDAAILHHFIFALGFSRIHACPGIETFACFKGYIAESMKKLIQRLTD